MCQFIKNTINIVDSPVLSHSSDDYICDEHAQLLHRGDHTLPLRQDILHLYRYGMVTVANCFLVPLSLS